MTSYVAGALEMCSAGNLLRETAPVLTGAASGSTGECNSFPVGLEALSQEMRKCCMAARPHKKTHFVLIKSNSSRASQRWTRTFGNVTPDMHS